MASSTEVCRVLKRAGLSRSAATSAAPNAAIASLQGADMDDGGRSTSSTCTFRRAAAPRVPAARGLRS